MLLATTPWCHAIKARWGTCVEQCQDRAYSLASRTAVVSPAATAGRFRRSFVAPARESPLMRLIASGRCGN